MTQPAHRVVQISVIDWANSLNGKPPIGADLARLIATLAAAVEADRASTHARSSERTEEAEADALRLHGEKMEIYERAIAAEARLAELSERAAHRWQPIETATKDGSRTLIAWLTIKNEWRFSFAKWDPSIEHYCLEDRDAMVGARYWMPLPAPDAVSGSTEGGK